MPSNRYDAEFPPPQLVAEIRQRLGGVCMGWPPELFESMTARAAWIEFKYERAMVDGFRPLPFRDDRATPRRSKAG